MKTHQQQLISLAAMAVMILRGTAAENHQNPPPVRGYQEVGQARVELSGGFWGPRIKTAHEVTIPHALDELEKDGHVTNFDKAAGKFDGPLKGHPRREGQGAAPVCHPFVTRLSPVCHPFVTRSCCWRSAATGL